MKRNKMVLASVVFLAVVMAATGCKADPKENGRSGRDDGDEETVVTEVDENEETEDEPAMSEETEPVTGGSEDEPDETEPEASEPEVYCGVHPDDLDIPGGSVRHGEIVYSNGDVQRAFDHYYDADGNEVLVCYISDEGELLNSDYFEYDDSGRLVREEAWRTGGLADGLVSVYTYGDDGLLQNVTEESAYGDPHFYTTYEYDDQGRVTFEHRFITNTDTETQGYEYVYDEDGMATRYYWSVLATGELERSEGIYSRFNADGQIAETAFENFTPYEYTVYTYDENGNLITEEKFKGQDRNPNGSTVYEYDDMGRLISEVSYYASGAVSVSTTYTYEAL